MTKGIFSLVFFLVACYLSCSVVAWLFHNYFVKFSHCVMSVGGWFHSSIMWLHSTSTESLASCSVWQVLLWDLGQEGVVVQVGSQEAFALWCDCGCTPPPPWPSGIQPPLGTRNASIKTHLTTSSVAVSNREKCTFDKDAWKQSHIKLDLKTKWSQLKYHHVIIILLLQNNEWPHKICGLHTWVRRENVSPFTLLLWSWENSFTHISWQNIQKHRIHRQIEMHLA